jgi:hypothetical protein
VRKLSEFEYNPHKSFRSWLRTDTLKRFREGRRKRPAVAENGVPLEELAVPDTAEALWEDNALIIPALIPLALKGVTNRPLGANALLRRNLVIWVLGGVIAPFVGIKGIDLILGAVNVLQPLTKRVQPRITRITQIKKSSPFFLFLSVLSV